MINQRLVQIKEAAESATRNRPEQFAEIFARLICEDICKQLQTVRATVPGEVGCTPDGYAAWMMALVSSEIKIKEYFQS